MNWQPINTAPRDIDILVTDGIEITGARFNPYEPDRIDIIGCRNGGCDIEPTHWMLRPELPK